MNAAANAESAESAAANAGIAANAAVVATAVIAVAAEIAAAAVVAVEIAAAAAVVEIAVVAAEPEPVAADAKHSNNLTVRVRNLEFKNPAMHCTFAAVFQKNGAIEHKILIDSFLNFSYDASA